MRKAAFFVVTAFLVFALSLPAVAAAESESGSSGIVETDTSSVELRDVSRDAELAGDDTFDIQADSGRTLKVAFPYARGLSETDENGVHSGALYDWLIEISKYTGWNYEFITGDTDALLAGLLAGDFDLTGGMFYRDEYADSLIYPDYMMGSNYSVLLYKKDDPTIKSFDLATLDGKTIGAFGGATDKIARLENFLEYNDIDCTVRPYDSLKRYQQSLDNGEVDILLSSDTELREDCDVAARFKSEPQYIAVAGDERELAQELNEAMIAIYAADPAFADELYEKYFPDTRTGSVAFTDEDRQFVEQAQPIRVSLTVGKYPMYYERDGVQRGIAKGVFDLISERTGLTFEYVPCDSYQDALDSVLKGDADVMGMFMDDEYFANSMDLALSKNYMTLDEVVLRNKSSDYPSDGLAFALPMGRTKPEGIKAAHLVYYPSYEACLEAVNAGEVDLTSMPSSFAEGLYVEHYYANVTPVAADHVGIDLSIAFSRPVDSRLYSVINKAVNSFSDDEVETVLSRNVVSVTNRQISIQSLLYDSPVATLAMGAILLLLLIGIILLIARSKIRNRMLQLKLEKAEETGRAKSDFLSRMSHEIRTPMNAIIGLTTIASHSEEATPGMRTSLDKINTSAKFLLALVNDILDMSKIENNKMQLECESFNVRALSDQMQSMVGIQAEENGLMMITECDVEDGCVVGDSIRIQQVLANLLSNAFKFTDPGGAVVLSIKEVARNEKTARIRFGVKDTGIGIAPDDLERVFESFEQASENQKNIQGTGLGLAISANLVNMMGAMLRVDSTVGEGSEFYFSVNLPVSDSCESADPEDPVLLHAVPLAGTKLLLAEDNDLNAEIAMALLEMEGIEVTRAANGQEVVDIFLEKESEFFDFILMDVKMPVKDGLAASLEIRALDRADARTVPIIAITANTFQEDRDSTKAAGMDGFVPKPFDAEELYDTLRAFRRKTI